MVAHIELRNVSKTFQSKEDSVEALKDISLVINQKDFYGIIGMSGAGKSTLIRTMNYLNKPDSGEVLIHKENLGDLSEKQLLKKRQAIGMIFQHFNLLNQISVLDNVILPLKIAKNNKTNAKEKAIDMLNRVGLTDKSYSYPSELSGGQKQRVAIARALINDPDILLCDEATSALDPISTQSILELLKKLQNELNLTIVLITHEMSVIEKVCNKVAILDDGKVVEQGFISDIFVNPKSSAAKKLLFLQETHGSLKQSRQALRLIFDGQTADKPLISQLVLKTKQEINILWANTKEIDGKVYGQMMIEISKDKDLLNQITDVLKISGINYSLEGGDIV